MRLSHVSFLTLLLAGVVAVPAAASVTHTVAPGESLWSIALADGQSPGALAAANGLPVDAHLQAGTAIVIPPGGGSSGTTAATPAGVTAATTGTGSGSSRSYVVQPGDTLSGIAARAGLSTSQLAAANGLSLEGPLLAGSALTLAGGSAGAGDGDADADDGVAGTTSTAMTSAAPVSGGGSLSGSQIGSIAAANGVPASLAQAVAWQESGFNNNMVSGANAHGIMQIVPSTWQWVQNAYGGPTLDPSSPTDNVTVGSRLLASLLRDTGGDTRMALAGYYQGLDSVRRIGVLPETQQYIDNVLALQQHFGG